MSDFSFPSIKDYSNAYRQGRCTPVDVANNIIEAVERADAFRPPMRLFISLDRDDLLHQAEESAKHLAEGTPRGPLEGIPVPVKDEIDQAGYPTTVGTSFLGTTVVPRDATVVARLRSAGALLVGKTNMHEIGIGLTGINPHHGSARNPYDPNRISGGSSSGSAAVVASGLCPVSIGADGGGSIRVPAALCGIAGIKPTAGRVSEHGAAPLCWSLATIGPFAAHLGDAAMLLKLIAGEDPHDPSTLGQPPLTLDSINEPVKGLRLGWCDRWSNKASVTMQQACRSAVDGLVARGAELCSVSIDHLDMHKAAELVTIGAEMAASQYEHRKANKLDYAADTRLLLEIASHLTAVEYVRAQRLRTMILRAFLRVLDQVDLIVTPMTMDSAPVLPPDAEIAGMQDEALLEALSTFGFAANLAGLPAISVPVGYDPRGLPLGMQIIGGPWQEELLVHVGLAVEAELKRRAPRINLVDHAIMGG